MYYKINNGAVQFGADTILHHINFEIKNNEKIAVVGRNGCGKTTLLKLISGEVELQKRSSDEDIFIAQSGNPVIGYLKQMAFEDDEATLSDEVHKAYAPILALKERMEELTEILNTAALSAEETERYAKEYTRTEEMFSLKDGYDIERECDMMLSAFGFPKSDRERKLSEFSGGQRTKIAFVKLLLSKPDILLLDEPTNHLDIASVEWLEQYVKAYPSAVVIVSHDRMFLDNVVNVVYEIEYGTTVRYPGNYTDFVRQKRENYEKQRKDYFAQQKEIERLSELVEKFKHHPTKVSMAWSKQKAIDHMEKIELPDRYDLKSFHANCMPLVETGSTVLTVKELGIGYDTLLSEVSFELKKGRKLAVIGANGIGKSTLLKTIVGKVPPLAGSITYGLRVEYGYFDQQIAQYSSDKTVLNDMWDEFPNLTETEVRTLLGSFLFSGDDVFKEVAVLSGGERSRLQLAKLFKRRPNFLILDEPTNHMDIVGKEKLEEMLKDYTGTVLFVSHDRYMVSHIADSLLVFDKEGVHYFDGTYPEYLEKRKDIFEAFIPENRKAKRTEEKQAPVNIGKEKSRLLRKMEKIEAEIEETENAVASMEEEMNDPAIGSDFEKLSKLQLAIEEGKAKVDRLMETWEALASEESSM